jgi:hypothetical protein
MTHDTPQMFVANQIPQGTGFHDVLFRIQVSKKNKKISKINRIDFRFSVDVKLISRIL